MAKANPKLKRKTPEQRTDADWRAINDARSLSYAQMIQDDPARLKAAIQWAAVLAEEESDEAQAMQKVSNLTA